MASTVLYPPTVDNYAPAFIASGNSAFCRVYFSLSKISMSTAPIRSVHISVIKQNTGRSVVLKEDDPSALRYRSSGILIINQAPIPVVGKENLYYIDILNNDIINGWTVGWIYKIQIRLSSVVYDGGIGQNAWLNANASNFSEWSTYCTTKSIGSPRIKIPILKGYDSDLIQNGTNSERTFSLSLSTLELNGSYENVDLSENLYSYSFTLYKETGELIEYSDILYTNQYYNPNQFYYLFKTELENNTVYKLKFSYQTVNKYQSEIDFILNISRVIIEQTNINAITLDNVAAVSNIAFQDNFKKITKLAEEEEEGRIAVKLYSINTNPYNGNICLRRCDSRDNFSTWTDIKIISCINTVINNLDVIWDYTVESGVWYKYGVQTISTAGERGIMNPQKNAIIREFEYSYLLGEGGRQLKLNLSGNVSNYSYAISEQKTDTIGGKFPVITRNGNMNYRTFSISAMISFNMDEQNTFSSDKDLYKHDNIINLYKDRRRKEYLNLYDYKREYDFREKVLEFLQDGKPKLFKSSTEGNVIVRLMTVAEQPNQSLNRMIGTVSMTAYEVAEPTMENYLKYGFYEVGHWSIDFTTYITKLGQLDIGFKVGDNIIDKIWEKYDFSTQNIAGARKTVKKVHHLSLEFSDRPLRVYNNANEEVLGNNVLYGASKITVYGGRTRYYYFDENIEFTKGSSLIVLGEIGDTVDTVHITVDFLYEIGSEPYIPKQIDTKISYKGIGQIYNTYKPETSIYSDIYYKYYYEWQNEFRRLSKIDWICIETNPRAVFMIQDETDNPNMPARTMYHEVNQTGVLNIEGLTSVKEIKYIGMKDPTTGEINSNIDCDIVLDYLYYTTEGTYRKEYL